MQYKPRGLSFVAITFLTVFFVVAMPVFATQVSSQDITVDVGSNDVSRVAVNIDYADLTTSKISYIALARIGNVYATDEFGPLSCSFSAETYGTVILCTPNSADLKNYSVDLTFDAYQLSSPSAMANILSYNYMISDPIDALHVMLILPEATGIVSDADFDPIYPFGWSLGSTGRRTTIAWDVEKPELGKTYTFTADYEPITHSTFNYNSALVVIIVVLFGLLIFFRFRASSNVRTVLSVLRPDEKNVVDAITQRGKECLQRDIVKATDFSKAKVSRIVTDLEVRGIIKRTRRGRTNKICIAKHANVKKTVVR